MLPRFVQRDGRGPLARSVAALWWSATADLHGREWAMPTAAPQLLIELTDGPGVAFARTSGVLVQGPNSRPSVLYRCDQARIAGVTFRPGGLRALVGPTVADLADQDVALEHLLPAAEAERVRARLASAPSPEAALDVLEAELLALAIHPVDPRVHRAVLLLERGPVAAVARELGMSDRRLTLWFREQVGLGPKRFARVLRFQRVLRPLLAGADLGELAYTCGYYDQAHLNREFRAFAGVTPTEYRARGPAHPNHLPDLDQT